MSNQTNMHPYYFNYPDNTNTVFARIQAAASIFSNDNKCGSNSGAASIRGRLQLFHLVVCAANIRAILACADSRYFRTNRPCLINDILKSIRSIRIKFTFMETA
jgi:hypothetical protein